MKKITFLMMLLPVYLFAQDSWTFDDTDENWTRNGFDIASPISGSIVLTAIDGNNDPRIAVAGPSNISIDATKHMAAVTMKVGADGPEQMRVSFPKSPSGRVYINIDITKGDANFKTYYVDCTDADWTGTIQDLQIRFEGPGGATYTGTTSTTETVEIDRIEFFSVTAKASYFFDAATGNDPEGWTSSSGDVSVSNDKLVFEPTNLGNGRLEQKLHFVSTNNNYVHFRIYNESPNNQIRVRNGNGEYLGDIALTANQVDETYVEVSKEISHVSRWPGGTNDNLIFDIRNTGNAGNKASAGTISIDFIEINQKSLVADSAVKEQSSISVYPNPVKDQLNIASEKTIIELSILNTVGKLVAKGNSAQLATDALPAGVYLVSVVFGDGQTHTQKIIKE